MTLAEKINTFVDKMDTVKLYKEAIRLIINEKGVTVDSTVSMSEYAALIGLIEGVTYVVNNALAVRFPFEIETRPVAVHCNAVLEDMALNLICVHRQAVLTPLSMEIISIALVEESA